MKQPVILLLILIVALMIPIANADCVIDVPLAIEFENDSSTANAFWVNGTRHDVTCWDPPFYWYEAPRGGHWQSGYYDFATQTYFVMVEDKMGWWIIQGEYTDNRTAYLIFLPHDVEAGVDIRTLEAQ